jgi:diaminohydroxyphosphoribosylaminopyrimidine deaminase/5-amino-6-(5-phosphoribosylamino)uracil reductase
LKEKESLAHCKQKAIWYNLWKQNFIRGTMSRQSIDEKYMRMALRIAERARGETSPNPLVGALVVKDNKIIGRGYHRKAGGPHAEVLALNKAGENARGSVLYVTLEPCSHTDKRTPPCAPLIAQSGITRVVIAMIDPNPRVSGNGVKSLRAAGIELTTGVLEGEAKKMNEAFIKHITEGTPFVTLKIAQTLDGRIATASGESKWITGMPAREEGHRFRHINDAILVGINTVLADDPLLTARIPKGRDPIRVIVDGNLRIPLTAKVLTQKSSAKTIVVVFPDASKSKTKKLQGLGAEVLIAKREKDRVDLRDLLKKLGKMDIMSVLIEGGAEINASALKAGIVDKVVQFMAPILMTGRDSLCSIGGTSPGKLRQAVKLSDITTQFVGQDLMLTGYIRHKEHTRARSHIGGHF